MTGMQTAIHKHPIFARINDAICLHDRESGAVIDANEKACELFGCTMDQVFDMNVADLCLHNAGCHGHHQICPIKNVLKGRTQTLEWRTPTKSGHMRWVEAVVEPIELDGEEYLLTVLRDQTPQKRMAGELQNRIARSREMGEAIVQSLLLALEARDPITAQHQKNTSHLAEKIASEMMLPHHQVETIRVAASLHDLGKLSVIRDILEKPCGLTDEEFAVVKEHSDSGYNILKDIPFDGPVAETVQQHHERIDGSGYPNQLQKDDILLEARILAVADALDAMISDRPYRKAMPREDALYNMIMASGTQFDPDVVDAALEYFLSQTP